MTDSPLTIFQVAGRAMSAQLVRMNTTASNLANAGGIASSADAAYKTIKPVFRTQYDNATGLATRSEEHTSELQSLMRISYAVLCLKKTKTLHHQKHQHT